MTNTNKMWLSQATQIALLEQSMKNTENILKEIRAESRSFHDEMREEMRLIKETFATKEEIDFVWVRVEKIEGTHKLIWWSAVVAIITFILWAIGFWIKYLIEKWL